METSNAAFDDGNKHWEINRILKGIVQEIENMNHSGGRIRDINGNTIGSWDIDDK
tara:strand:- start:1196 stop:1360 length:165 start_codon:yes stop_codon:yes gene_type:complete